MGIDPNFFLESRNVECFTWYVCLKLCHLAVGAKRIVLVATHLSTLQAVDSSSADEPISAQQIFFFTRIETDVLLLACNLKIILTGTKQSYPNLDGIHTLHGIQNSNTVQIPNKLPFL